MTTEEGDRRTWELAGQLVQTNSSDSGVYEGQIERWIYERSIKKIEEKTGALKNQVELVQREAMPGRSNLMARIPGKEQAPAPALVYICYMDMVMLGEEWEEETPVLGIVAKGGRLYGRGACDMKSDLVCAMSVLLDIVELTGSTGELPARPSVLTGTVDEEDFMRGVEGAIRNGWTDREDWAPDTGSTGGQTQVAHKGRTWSELTIQGITAYANNPWEGADAIVAMAEVVSHIRKAIGSCPLHEDLDMSMVTFGQAVGGYRPYVVPDSCKVWIGIRPVPPTDTVVAKNIVEEAIKVAEAEIAEVRGSYPTAGDRPYVEKNNSSWLLTSLKFVCDRVTGEDAPIGSFNGYTGTAAIVGTPGNCNCMSYGLGSLELAHKPDEYVPYRDVCRCRRVLTELVRQETFLPFAF